MTFDDVLAEFLEDEMAEGWSLDEVVASLVKAAGYTLADELGPVEGQRAFIRVAKQVAPAVPMMAHLGEA